MPLPTALYTPVLAFKSQTVGSFSPSHRCENRRQRWQRDEHSEIRYESKNRSSHPT